MDPEIIVKEGEKVGEKEYLAYVAGVLKIPAGSESFRRFEGSNGCVAFAFPPMEASLTGEDKLGQPLIGGKVRIVSWNPFIRRHKGKYYDLLAYSTGR